MCGICGIAAIEQNSFINEQTIVQMMRAIKHRGPDEDGFFLDERIAAMGHTRLSIIDLSSGQQPIFNENGKMCIIFNGEIYNYMELRKVLLDRGHRFTTNSDTEVILHLYEEKGPECLNFLRGMFAFAIWDATSRTLFLARDRLGIKPLYYTIGSGWLAFASEIKSLILQGLATKEVNYPIIDQYLALNYTIGPETIFENVKKLMPGHFLTYTKGKVYTEEYWDIATIEQSNEPYQQSLQRMEELIEEAVKMRLMSEVPLGAFLSGGVDSSVTVGIMTKLTGKPVKTFTVGYENAEDVSELSYARIVARHFGSDHHEFLLKPKHFMDIITKVIWHLDEPVAEYATIPLLLLSELAKKYVTVMLSGEGADEIFAGYPIYRYMRYIENYQKITKPVPASILNFASSLTLKHKKEGKYLDWLMLPLERRYLGNGSYFTEKMRDHLYSHEFKKTLNRQNLYDVIDHYYERVLSRDVIRRMLYLDTKTWLPEDLLIKADKMTMASAIELRVPFLDHKLVEFATSLPSKRKVHAFQSKYIFKQYAEKLLPKEIVHRKKQGFPVPIRQWLRQELNLIAKDILLDPITERRGLFNKDYILRMFAQHSAMKEDFSKNLWNLLILEMWFRVFVDAETSTS
jgi:asparagine synthase (glutamine-hydrolysing)